MRRIIAATLALGLTVMCVWSCCATSRAADKEAKSVQRDDDGKGKRLAKFMRAKLGSTDKILEGLVTEDFEKIAEGAKELETLSSAEQWRVSNDAMYAHFSADFRLVAKNLQKDAADKELDAASMKYIRLTLSCIECHKFVRATLVADQ
jgi:hypothetical protein